jgi:hypothetical protein
MALAAALTLCISTCPIGEFLLFNCTATHSAVCWPCEPGFACNTTSKAACVDSWSNASSASCFPCAPGPCPSGMVSVRECSATSDRVCAPCPDSFGCINGTMQLCGAGTHSLNGVCVPGNSSASCAPGEVAVGGRCRVCPDGYGCVNERIELCRPNTYSVNGTCVPCSVNSKSPSGSSSSDHCLCIDGYVRAADICSCCKEGTVWKNGRCELCAAGSYCMGKMHSETCPRDMWSPRGSAVCVECGPFSNCQSRCTSAASCACDDGYVLDNSRCSRCGPGTQKLNEASCIRCAPGMECLGGAEVSECRLSTYSPGNLTSCLPCALCPELTRFRCNATHDSVCAGTREPLAVITVNQEFRTAVDGETFGAFAMVYTSALPKAQLQSICSERRCVDCFQGLCAMHQMRTLSGPTYTTAIEIRSETNRLVQNVEALTNTAFLLETAKTAMRKLTDVPFAAYSRVDHMVICPSGSWDGGACVQQQDGTAATAWLGLGAVVLVVVAVCSRRKRSG